MRLNRMRALFNPAAMVAAVAVMMGLTAVPASVRAQNSSSSAPQVSMVQEKSPSLVDPAGPTISLINSETVFAMTAALNACGYDEGLDDSASVRKKVREEINVALAKSESARDKRDKLCLFVAQHRMTGTVRDISQYISLALYLTPPPALEAGADLPEMPPDSTQVFEILPLLRDFVAAVDLHGIWLAEHHVYDAETDKIHDELSQMIVSTNLYLKMPASTYDGRRFIVIVEPMLAPRTINARVYGLEYVVVVSPQDGKIRMNDVRHTYLHYILEPLLYSRANALERAQPILKEIREAPLEFRLRSDQVALTIECLIKAIEARIMDTGIPVYKIPAGVDRSELPKYEHERQIYQQKVDAIKWATVRHDMTQGYVMTQYFYEQMVLFEKDPASLRDTIGEMVYSMDVDQQVHRARDLDFDKEADEDVLSRSHPRKLEGLDLAEARLAAGDMATATALARQALTVHGEAAQADRARAEFILARAAILNGHPEQAIGGFQRTIASSKEPRLLAWSHIYLGRMLDLQCLRDEALTEYKAALAVRDGQLDTRLAAERGVKAAYTVKGHSCDKVPDEDEIDLDKPVAKPNGVNAPAGTTKQQ